MLHRGTATVNKDGIGVNMLCGKGVPVPFTSVPAQTESKAVHSEAYNAMRRALRSFSAAKACDISESETVASA